MRVNVYTETGVEPLQRSVELREVMGDDDAEYYRALACLSREARYWTGGGAQPLLCLFRCADPPAVTFNRSNCRAQ